MKQLLVISKYIVAVSVIAGAALWFDARFDASEEGQEAVLDSVAELRQEILYVNVEQSFMAEDIMNVSTKVDANTEKFVDIIDAADFYMRNEERYTREEMREEIDIILKKNYTPIVFNEPKLIQWKKWERMLFADTSLSNMIYNSYQ